MATATFANPWHDEIGRFAPKGTGRKVSELRELPVEWTEKLPGMWWGEHFDGWRAAYDRDAMSPDAQAKFDEMFGDAKFGWQRLVNSFLPGVKDSGKVLSGTARSIEQAKSKAESAGQKSIDDAWVKSDERDRKLRDEGRLTIRQFANPWHDEIGRFAPKGSGKRHPLAEQMADWETSKPWNLTKEQAIAQSVPGFWHKNARETETASWDGKYIRTTDEFYALPEETRRAIAYHEAGHAMLEAAGGLTTIEDPLGLIDKPGGSALSYNAEEIIAEGYSVLWSEPDWFDRNGAHDIRDVVIAAAERAGFPLPKDVTPRVYNVDIWKPPQSPTGPAARSPRVQSSTATSADSTTTTNLATTNALTRDASGSAPSRGLRSACASSAKASFANPWHDEVGKFAPKGTGSKSAGRASKAEERKAKRLAKAKAKQVPKPTEADVIQGQVDALLAREGLVRPGGDRRGNNTARKQRAKKLVEEFGDGETCPCVDCGQRLAGDTKTAKRLGLDTLTQDKILVGPEGGSYKLDNLIPACAPCNQSRGDREGVGVTGDIDPTWGDPRRYVNQVVRANGEVIAERFQTRREQILNRRGISLYEHLQGNPDALPEDFDDLNRAIGSYRLDRRLINGEPGHHELGVDDPVRVDVPRQQFSLDGDVVNGVVEIVGGVPPEPLGSDHRAVLDNHSPQRTQFANPWHDELGKFAPKGTGRKVTSIGQDELAEAVAGLSGADKTWHSPASADHQAFIDQIHSGEGAFADPEVGEAWHRYASMNGYKEINRLLRDQPLATMRTPEKVAAMGEAMKTAYTPPPARPLPDRPMFRGESDGLGPTLKPGDTFTDKGFVSVTENSGSAALFAGEMGSDETWEQGSRTIYVISPTGKAKTTPVVAVESPEQEWALPPGSKFKVGNIIEHARQGYINDHDMGDVVDRIIELEWVE